MSKGQTHTPGVEERKTISFRLPSNESDALEKAARDLRASVSDYIRTAVEARMRPSSWPARVWVTAGLGDGTIVVQLGPTALPAGQTSIGLIVTQTELRISAQPDLPFEQGIA